MAPTKNETVLDGKVATPIKAGKTVCNKVGATIIGATAAKEKTWKEIEKEHEDEVKWLMTGGSDLIYMVNPYLVPSTLKTMTMFFNQLKKLPRLAMLADEVPIPGRDIDQDEVVHTYRLFDIISGAPNEEKKGVLEDCLFEFRKILIRQNVSEERLAKAESVPEKILLLKLDPVIVRIMYKQFFFQLKKHGIVYESHDFGIGSNREFRFNVFYSEDHPHLFSM